MRADTHTYTYIYIHISVCVHVMHIYIYICVCVCVETGKQPGKTTKSLNPSYNPAPKVHCFLSQGTPEYKGENHLYM